jgi:hypothetical protein
MGFVEGPAAHLDIWDARDFLLTQHIEQQASELLTFERNSL